MNKPAGALGLGAALTTALLAAHAQEVPIPPPDQPGVTFNQILDVMQDRPYGDGPLPVVHVTASSFSDAGHNLLSEAADRTLHDQSDYYEEDFDKLLHANGICFAGEWTIFDTAPPHYTGMFAPGARGLLAARASVTFTSVSREDRRGLAFAGKVFPTTDPDARVQTGNFFTIENLSGLHRDHFTDAELGTELDVGASPRLFLLARIVLAFVKADDRPDKRSLAPLAALGAATDQVIQGPEWARFIVPEGTARVDEDDFRVELARMIRDGGELTYEIHLADLSPSGKLKDAVWPPDAAGEMKLTSYYLSSGCDHRLHFSHPRYDD